MTEEGLVAEGLVVRFGGLTAVDDVGLTVPMGRLTGLIGPNGAGKTTTFNACSGLVQPTRGSITLFGRDISKSPPPVRARLGLGRTFQRMQLFDRLSVEENVSLGREARLAGTRRLGALWATGPEKAMTKRACDDAIQVCGLHDMRYAAAGALSTGERRLVELARVIAGGFSILLLDEPSSGLDAAETAMFGEILRNVSHDRGTGILLVEHDMSLVASACEYIYVLDFGKLIEEGPAHEVLASEVVRNAYLGAEAV